MGLTFGRNSQISEPAKSRGFGWIPGICGVDTGWSHQSNQHEQHFFWTLGPSNHEKRTFCLVTNPTGSEIGRRKFNEIKVTSIARLFWRFQPVRVDGEGYDTKIISNILGLPWSGNPMLCTPVIYKKSAGWSWFLMYSHDTLAQTCSHYQRWTLVLSGSLNLVVWTT